jgi:hypothetical protein
MNEKGENPDAEPSGETPVCTCDCHEDGAGCCPTCYEFWAMIGKIRVERDELAKKLAEAAAMLRTARGALESYRYGNASPDLAEECVMAITNVLDGER